MEFVLLCLMHDLQKWQQELVFKYVSKYFGILEDIVSDKVTQFTGYYWMGLFNMVTQS